jgi:hypothetical protein
MDTNETKPGNSVKALFTRTRANDGARLDIKDEAGDPTGNWLLVRGVDSDAVQAALLEFNRAKTEPKSDLDVKVVRPFDDPDVVSAMVSGWSFDEPCTPAAVKEALVEAPYIRVNVVNLAFERARFLPPRQSSSSDTPKQNSD